MPAWLTYIYEVLMPMDAELKKLTKRVVALEKQLAAQQKKEESMSAANKRLADLIAALQAKPSGVPEADVQAEADKFKASNDALTAIVNPPAPPAP
jgi:hypothetical protein